MTRIITYIVSALLAFMGCGVLVSCQDDRLDYPGGPIEPGISTMDVTLAFKDYTPALNETRAAGDAIKNIRTLWLVIYDNKSRLVKKSKLRISRRRSFLILVLTTSLQRRARQGMWILNSPSTTVITAYMPLLTTTWKAYRTVTLILPRN